MNCNYKSQRNRRRRFGEYPPDLEQCAIDLVLRQAEYYLKYGYKEQQNIHDNEASLRIGGEARVRAIYECSWPLRIWFMIFWDGGLALTNPLADDILWNKK